MEVGWFIMSVFEHLKGLLNVQVELLDIAKKKEEVLIKNEIEELNKLIRLESSLVSKSRLLEKSVTTLLSEQSLISYIENEEMPTSDLIAVQKQLLDTVYQLKEQNDLNQKLLQDSLTFVQGSIQLLQPESKTYTKEAAAKSKPRTLFDSKA